MSTAGYIVNVPKLKGRENYDDWAFAVRNFLVLEGFDIDAIPADISDAENRKAKAKVVMTIDPSLYVHIKNENTVSNLWNKLKQLFDDSGYTRKISLLRSLISIRLENCESMTSYVSQMVETAQRLKGTGFEINDEWVGSLLLAGLPDKYSPMIMAIEHSGISISADVIKTKLMDMQVEKEADGNAFLSRKKNTPSNKKQPSSEKIIKCYKCKQIGHYKNQCPKKDKTEHAFSAVFLNGTFTKDEWYIDSGASNHMIIEEKILKNSTRDHNKPKEIVVANKTTMPVLCSGDAQLTTVVGKNKFDITVKDVLCVPSLTTNLLSVSQLIKNGNQVYFKKDKCYIKNPDNQLIGVAPMVNGVYKLNTGQCFAATATSSIGIWHRRLGHINSNDQNIMKNGAVEGMEYNSNQQVSMNNCTVCCEGKQHRLPFPKSNNRSEKVLELVHADVCGPMETKSIGSSKYFLLFVDDYSRMSFVYFMKCKSEVFTYFKEFKMMVEKQTNSSIKILRSDNGTEFCSNQVANFLKQSGIVHQKTNTYTPEQNGMCERFNRTIVERARCLLYDAKFEKKFWAEAVHTAVYLKNRTLASGLQKKTPYELWHGRKPNISHFRIFGSSVMVHVPKEKRLKWDKKAIQHYLVGYADNVKGYRLYNPQTKKIVISRDVVIMEKESETSTVIITEAHGTPNPVSVSDSQEQQERHESSDSEDSDITIREQGMDSTYVPEEESSSSSVEFLDATTSTDLEDRTIVEDNTRLNRNRKKPDRLAYSNLGVDLNSGDDQITYQEALNGPESKEWREAMEKELCSFEENEAWEVVSRPENATVVKCKWVFKKKLDNNNKVTYRARLVAKGFTQAAGIDYKETFSPVVRYSTLRLLFALSIKHDLDITHLDVNTAFLNGYLNETVYMTLPENFKCTEKNKVLKLKKAIYGLKQSARAWYKRVDDCLHKSGYKKSEYEPCLFLKQKENVKVYIALFVDDFFIFSNCKKETELLKDMLKANFKLKDLGEVKQCLGMRVRRCNNEISLDQEQFVDKILSKFNMKDCKTANTPIEVNLKLKKEGTCSAQYPYQQLIGSLLYLALLTRPDIYFAVCYLSQFNSNYNETHWKHVKHILKYLKKTKNYGLKYVKDNSDITGFVDADWASDSLDRKSFTGFTFKLSNSVISFECKKQTTIALSSTEAEYMALCEASKEAIYLKNLLFELQCRSKQPIILYNDNQSALKLTKNNVFHKRSKHIDIRYHFIRSAVENNIVDVVYLNTEDMPADILTKSLCSQKHYKFVKQLGISEL